MLVLRAGVAPRHNGAMGWRLAADTVLVAHLAFVAFIVFGGFVAARRPRVAPAHLLALTYGAMIEAVGFTCPLTPLEKSLRASAGQAGYEGGFVEHYVVAVLYPGELTPGVQLTMVALVAAVSLVAYRRWLLRLVPA